MITGVLRGFKGEVKFEKVVREIEEKRDRKGCLLWRKISERRSFEWYHTLIPWMYSFFVFQFVAPHDTNFLPMVRILRVGIQEITPLFLMR